MFKNRYRFHLQHFGGDGGDNQPNNEGDTTPDTVTLSAEELQRKIEAESDRKLASALEKKQKEWEQKLEQEKQEAERLAKLSAKERQEEELTIREKEIDKRIKELEQRELKADAISDLKDKGLPADFADFLLANDAEGTLANINAFKTAFDEAVNEAVKEKLRQDTPKTGGGFGATKNPFSKEHFNLTEQGRLLKEEPELYRQLKAQAGK